MKELLTGDVNIPILGIAFGTVWDMKLEVGDVQTRQLDVEVVDKMWEIPVLQRSPNQNIHNCCTCLKSPPYNRFSLCLSEVLVVNIFTTKIYNSTSLVVF